MCVDYFDIEELKRWFNDDGDNKYRFNYNLDENSLVFDLGGYDGEWSKKIYDKYNCNIFIFEPVEKYYNLILNKFNYTNKIKVFNFGLSNSDTEIDIYFDNASSSIYFKSDTKEKVLLKDINKFINDNNINKVDLIKINIEGAEFDLLDYIIEIDKQTLFHNIQVQFHKMFDDCYIRRYNIREDLSKTHKITYDYSFVWENWELKQ